MATSEAGKEEAGENGPPCKLLFFLIRKESLSQGPFRRIPLRFHWSVLGLRLILLVQSLAERDQNLGTGLDHQALSPGTNHLVAKIWSQILGLSYQGR